MQILPPSPIESDGRGCKKSLMFRSTRLNFGHLVVAASLAGCHQDLPSTHPTSQPTGQIVASVSARCFPPPNWSPDPLKSGANHTHQVWISPSGHTAYGVMHFNLPIPVTRDIVLFVFLQEMRMREGESRLLGKQPEPNLTRFVARGGRYTVHAELVVRGLEGWIAYAGTRTDESVLSAELVLAEEARDRTRFGAER